MDGHIIKPSLGESDHKKDLPGVIGVWVPELAFAVRGIHLRLGEQTLMF